MRKQREIDSKLSVDIKDKSENIIELADLSVQYRGTKMDAQLADYIIGESGCETSHSPHVAITEHVTLGW